MFSQTTNILFTLPNLSPNHSKLPRVLAITKALDRQRFQPIVSVDHNGRLHQEGLRMFEEADVPVYVVRMTPHRRDVFRSLFEMMGTPRKLSKSHVVIQHSSDYGRSWTEPLLARLGGVRYWTTIKTNTEIGGWHWRVRLQLAHRVVVEAPQVADLLIATVPNIQHRLVSIPKGIDTNVFKPGSRDEQLINELSFVPDRLVLGCVAHLVPYKNYHSLFHALKILDSPSILVLIAGASVDMNYTRSLQHQVYELGLAEQVIFLGERSDISRLHNIMDGLILVSDSSEASPTAIVEGMSSGLPIIASDVAGIPAIVRDGINGWIVPRGDRFVERLADAIRDWADSPHKRKSFGLASRRIVEENFSLTQMTQNYINLFESLIEQKR